MGSSSTQGRPARLHATRAALLLLLASLLALPAHAGVEPSLVRSPYLQMGTPTSMVVRWRTDVATESRISYGPAADDLSNTISTPALVTDHEIPISELEPGTRYYYAVGTDSLTLAGGDPEHYFETSPPVGSRERTRIWVVGDSGQCSSPTRKDCDTVAAVRDKYLAYAEANGGKADLWLMLGDNAYSIGSDEQYTEAVFEVFPQVMRNTPLWPVIGNHDLGPLSDTAPYFQAFTLPALGEAGGAPSGTEEYYSFDYGNIHFVALNSNRFRRYQGVVWRWVEEDLQSTDADWLIAFWHHPPYTKGSHDSDTEIELVEMRENFVPLLEDYGVDLQLTGHSHSYERSMLIDGQYGTSDTFDPEVDAIDSGDGDPEGDGAYAKEAWARDPHEGTVYAVVGSSSKNSGGPLNHPVMVRSINYEGAMVIDIEGDTLEAVWIDQDGVVADSFRLDKVPEPAAGVAQLAALGALVLVRRRRAQRGR